MRLVLRMTAADWAGWRLVAVEAVPGKHEEAAGCSGARSIGEAAEHIAEHKVIRMASWFVGTMKQGSRIRGGKRRGEGEKGRMDPTEKGQALEASCCQLAYIDLMVA
ncbi:hypothetical protein DUI87_28346 [Hirundo rustica rustica]|uniref:Uncharacterized protein n=1 Tax=Hirundo rustica rustica TaxID=333673 RepID=A0A3M0J366_HIRRU|nr:hypothetical protein DUI87_28346 [Hirundo rustica rustica]